MTPVVRSKAQAPKQKLMIGWVTDHGLSNLYAKSIAIHLYPFVYIHIYIYIYQFVVIGHGLLNGSFECLISSAPADICRQQAEPRPQPAGLSDAWQGGSSGTSIRPLHMLKE